MGKGFLDEGGEKGNLQMEVVAGGKTTLRGKAEETRPQHLHFCLYPTCPLLKH